MNKSLLIACFGVFFVISACKNKKATVETLDTTHYYLDSLQITQFFSGHTQGHPLPKLLSFYQKRNNTFAWINNGGVNEYAGNFINLLRQEKNNNLRDSVFYRDKLYSLFNTLTDDDYKFTTNDSLATALELLLTMNFFDYTKRNWGDVNDAALEKTGWFIDRKRVNVAHFLDTVLSNNHHDATANEPVNRQYGLLKNYLQQYYRINQNGGWPTLKSDMRAKKGDSAMGIESIKKELHLTGDLVGNDTSILFTDALELAVKQFQNRTGLPENGIVDEATLQALRVPATERIQQILINMERSRWMPVAVKGDYLGVNIPEFQLHVYHNETLVWSCNVVVGNSKPARNSVIFNDQMENIVFSPYWNVPTGILKKEVVPGIQKNSHYLANHNMEVVTYDGKPVTVAINWDGYNSNFPYLIREKPGIKNSLGLVKFLFPNSYDIYLHDSPQKTLFNETSRTFSHGCIRVAEPVKLAKFLLRNNPVYTDAKINALMNGGKETFVPLPTKVPVYIAYFTSFVDRSGKLNFRNDIYRHDTKMKQLLFVN